MNSNEFGLSDIMFMQDDEINLQCQLVEKLKQQMLDQDEVRHSSQKEKNTHTIRTHKLIYIPLLSVPFLPSAPGLI